MSDKKRLFENAAGLTSGTWEAINQGEPIGHAPYKIQWSKDGKLVADVVYERADAFCMAASKDMFYAISEALSDLHPSGEHHEVRKLLYSAYYKALGQDQ